MEKMHQTPHDSSETQTSEREDPRLPYVEPVIIDHGDVRDVTLGGSPGSGDSGTPTIEDPPSFN